MGGFRVKGVPKQNVTRVDPVQHPHNVTGIVAIPRYAGVAELVGQRLNFKASDNARDPVSFRPGRARPYGRELKTKDRIASFCAKA